MSECDWQPYSWKVAETTRFPGNTLNGLLVELSPKGVNRGECSLPHRAGTSPEEASHLSPDQRVWQTGFSASNLALRPSITHGRPNTHEHRAQHELGHSPKSSMVIVAPVKVRLWRSSTVNQVSLPELHHLRRSCSPDVCPETPGARRRMRPLPERAHRPRLRSNLRHLVAINRKYRQAGGQTDRCKQADREPVRYTDRQTHQMECNKCMYSLI